MNIAIINDGKIWRDKAHRLVEKHYNDIEMTIDEFGSGGDSLEKKQKYDFVLMDVEMDELNGFETISQYRLFFDDFIAIIFTTHMEVSAQGYLVNLDKIKNFDNSAVYFANDEFAYISKRRYSETKKQYLKRRREISCK